MAGHCFTFAAVKVLGSIFGFLFHLWFYFSNLIAILVLLPFMFGFSLSPKGYRYFFTIERLWAWIVLLLCGYWPVVEWQERPKQKGQYIICPNHTSMVDIMLTLAVFPNRFLFIGKAELAKMPLFGYFYKRTNLLVDRSSLRSRKMVFEAAATKLREGEGLCIYPEGMTPREDILLAPFKAGAFKLADELNIPIIPVTFYDCKKRLPFRWNAGQPGPLRVKVHPFLRRQDFNPPHRAEQMKARCFQIILQTLQQEEGL